jgi:hypothetical protein
MRGVILVLLHRPRRFGLEHLSAADAQQGQDGDGQNDQAHAAEPDHLRSPQIDRHRQVVQAAENGRAGGRQSGNGFKIGVGKTEFRAGVTRGRAA